MPPDKKTARGSRGTRRRKQRTTQVEQKATSPSPSSPSSSSGSDSDIGASGAEQPIRQATRPAKRPSSTNGPNAKKLKPNGGQVAAATPPTSSLPTSSAKNAEPDADEKTSTFLLDPVTENTTSSGSKEQTKQAPEAPKPDFDSWYLRAVTEQYGSDLERLRQAPDFKDSSVPILIDFLKQGTALFSEEEKRMVVGGG